MNAKESLRWAAGTPTEKMQWAIAFIGERLDALTDAQWEHWLWAVFNFAGGQLSAKENDWTRKYTRDCQQFTKDIIETWTDHNVSKGLKTGSKRTTFADTFLATRGIEELRFRFVNGKVEIAPRSASDVRQAFKFCFLVALAGIDTTRLRRCQACRAIFLATHGKQLHCTKRCSWRQGSKRYRTNNQQKLKVRRRVGGSV